MDFVTQMLSASVAAVTPAPAPTEPPRIAPAPAMAFPSAAAQPLAPIHAPRPEQPQDCENPVLDVVVAICAELARRRTTERSWDEKTALRRLVFGLFSNGFSSRTAACAGCARCASSIWRRSSHSCGWKSTGMTERPREITIFPSLESRKPPWASPPPPRLRGQRYAEKSGSQRTGDCGGLTSG